MKKKWITIENLVKSLHGINVDSVDEKHLLFILKFIDVSVSGKKKEKEYDTYRVKFREVNQKLKQFADNNSIMKESKIKTIFSTNDKFD